MWQIAEEIEHFAYVERTRNDDGKHIAVTASREGLQRHGASTRPAAASSDAQRSGGAATPPTDSSDGVVTQRWRGTAVAPERLQPASVASDAKASGLPAMGRVIAQWHVGEEKR